MQAEAGRGRGRRSRQRQTEADRGKQKQIYALFAPPSGSVGNLVVPQAHRPRDPKPACAAFSPGTPAQWARD